MKIFNKMNMDRKRRYCFLKNRIEQMEVVFLNKKEEHLE